MRCSILASLLEIAGWRKPGNVHRTRNFKDTRYEHFLAGVAAIQPCFRTFCERIFKDCTEKDKGLERVKLGEFYKEAAEAMMTWQKGGNVLLGHILILAPLIASAVLCLKFNERDLLSFRKYLRNVIKSATVEDTINLYEAIRICNPGGLGKVEKYDINDPNVAQQLQENNVTLLDIFYYSKDYDLISREHATNFKIILEEGVPYFLEVYRETGDINIATVNTYLKLLASHLDTLVIRKSGNQAAMMISEEASKILKHQGIITRKGRALIKKLDKKLQAQNGRMNPGTTADLISGIIFVALSLGIKF
ncbi:MAG: triphosphoribosyl-dephospho-CoA synthase [Promethearchaeota archaeon]